MQPLVLDTNILLDLWVFADAAAVALAEALDQGHVRWFATPAMREELARVLGYPHLAARLQGRGREAANVLAAFDARATLVPPPAKAPVTCQDPDDQKFVDLALERSALLLSKDRAVLCMARRLQRLGVPVATHWAPVPVTA